MSEINQRLDQVRNRIGRSAETAGRSPKSVLLLAVSKRHPTESIAAAYRAGQRDFGENYCQELLEKMVEVEKIIHKSDINWHFIGPVQSNKTRILAASVDWIHTLDREKIADRLSSQRPAKLAPLNVCIQVNIDREDSKSGVTIAETLEFAQYVNALPKLSLRGLMVIPENVATNDRATAFKRLADKFQEIKAHFSWPQWDTLSMGMSTDLEPAISEGATIVRVGTGIFGSRD